MTFRLMDHMLVPEHELLSEDEENEMLTAYRADKSQLPKILRSDPCIRALEVEHGIIEQGRIVRVIRESETSGRSVAFRVVVEG